MVIYHCLANFSGGGNTGTECDKSGKFKRLNLTKKREILKKVCN